MLTELLKKDPEDIFLNYALGLEYSSDLATVKESEQQYQKALSIDSTYLAAWYQLAKLYESQGRIPEAISHFKQGLEKARIKKDSKSISEFEEAIFLLEE